MMIKIRPEQLEVFRPAIDNALAGKFAEALRERHPGVIVRLPSGAVELAELSDSVLRKLVRPRMARAREYGLGSEPALLAFVSLSLVRAPNFDSHPLIQRVLKDATVAPDARLELLGERISDQTWEVVEREYDPSAWEIGDEA
ncbi:MAG TPA: hypothetical protein VJ302_04730 [Blastocatellia bacterium]|nr:hypothetical protein [Blastocatellia bacterium]